MSFLINSITNVLWDLGQSYYALMKNKIFQASKIIWRNWRGTSLHKLAVSNKNYFSVLIFSLLSQWWLFKKYKQDENCTGFFFVKSRNLEISRCVAVVSCLFIMCWNTMQLFYTENLEITRIIALFTKFSRVRFLSMSILSTWRK